MYYFGVLKKSFLPKNGANRFLHRALQFLFVRYKKKLLKPQIILLKIN